MRQGVYLQINLKLAKIVVEGVNVRVSLLCPEQLLLLVSRHLTCCSSTHTVDLAVNSRSCLHLHNLHQQCRLALQAKISKRQAPTAEKKGPQPSESPIAASNVMLYSEGQKVASRVGHR